MDFRHGGRFEVKDEIYFQSGSSSSPTPPRWSFKSVDATAASYGVQAIPALWLALLVMRQEIEAVAGGLWGMGGG